MHFTQFRGIMRCMARLYFMHWWVVSYLECHKYEIEVFQSSEIIDISLRIISIRYERNVLHHHVYVPLALILFTGTKFNHSTAVVWELISNFIQHFTIDGTIYPCWDWCWYLPVKWTPESKKMPSQLFKRYCTSQIMYNGNDRVIKEDNQISINSIGVVIKIRTVLILLHTNKMLINPNYEQWCLVQ